MMDDRHLISLVIIDLPDKGFCFHICLSVSCSQSLYSECFYPYYRRKNTTVNVFLTVTERQDFLYESNHRRASDTFLYGAETV